MAKARINAFLDNRTAPVSWDVTVGEMNTNYLVYEQDLTAMVYGPVVGKERYFHTKERIANYPKKDNMFKSKPIVFLSTVGSYHG